MKRSAPILLFCLVAYVAFRGPIALLGPFVLPFETGFQEDIALHHLRTGFIDDRLLPVFATIPPDEGDEIYIPLIGNFYRNLGQNFYHTAHPPLKHLIYAYPSAFEFTARLLSLILFTVSCLFWRRMANQEDKAHWSFLIPAFFLPMPFILATTTNYEPLSIFLISLFAISVLIWRSSLSRQMIILTAGLLTDWPAFLAVPALLIVKWKDRPLRKRLFIMAGYQTAVFAAIQAYQYAIAGEAAFFSHAPDRANPLAAFRPALWIELASHYIEITGWPLTIISAAALAVLTAGIIRRLVERKSIPEAPLFFLIFVLLLLASAPQLVARHSVYLLYFTPVLVFAFHQAIRKSSNSTMAVLALCILLAPTDYLLGRQRNYSYYGLAENFYCCSAHTAFSSSAVGAYYFYDRIETLFPMSKAVSRWLQDHQPDIVHLDLRHNEVDEATKWFENVKDKYDLFRVIPGERIFVLHNNSLLHRDDERSLLVESDNPEDYRSPVSMYTSFGKHPLCENVLPLQPCVVPLYVLRQHPGPDGSRVRIPLPPGSQNLLFAPFISHQLPWFKSDGVSFLAGNFSGEDAASGEKSLLYARFLANQEMTPKMLYFYDAYSSVGNLNAIDFVTLPGVNGNPAFDDAYWYNPVVTMIDKEPKHGQ